MTENFREILKEVKPFLEDYLEEMGVSLKLKGSNKFFSCIHPDHEDTNPSASIGRDGEFYLCFGCNHGGDIFTAASVLENKPLYGMGFVTENLQYLLQKYNIEHEPIELTEEQLSNYRYENIYNSAYSLMTIRDPNTMSFVHMDIEYAKERGWKDSTCEKLGIGSIKDYDKFINALSSKTNVPIEDLKSAGIHQDLFGPDLLTFCIRDYQGLPRGFVARYTKWKKGSLVPKYRNTSIDNNPFYRKEKILYMLDEAKKYKDMRLDIFEGYGSAVTAWQNGIKNCCSIGGTALTEHHVNLIRDLGFRHINLVLDADDTGTSKMDRYIDKFSGYNGLEVTITHLPFSEGDLSESGHNDPDFFIQKYGVESYRATKPMSFFQHMLNKSDKFEDSDPLRIDFCNRMVPLLINEPDLLRRSDMMKSLANHTSIDKEDIRLQIEKLERNDTDHIKSKLSKDLLRATGPDQLHSILQHGLTQLEDTTSTKQDRYNASLQETIVFFDDVFLEMNTFKEGIHGWKTGFTAFDEMFDGIPNPGTTAGRMIGFAGAPQHAKSATLLNIITRLVRNPDNKDLTALFWAIDDNRKTLAYRLIAMLSGVEMKKVTSMKKKTSEEVQAVREAQDLLRTLMIDRKIVIKDDKFGRSKGKALTWIKETQDQTSNNILFCVDSLHNVDGEGTQETRTKIMATSSWLKQLTASVPCTVLTTIELVKNRSSEKPNLQAMAESAKIEYDFDSIAICWNEQQGKYTGIENVAAKWGSAGSYKPIIELDVQKNKCGAGDKGSLYFKFDPTTTSFLDCTKYADFLDDHREINIEGRRGTTYTVKRSEKKPDTEKVEEDTEILDSW